MAIKLRISQSGTGAPTTITPSFIGEIYIDEITGTLYRSYGLSEGNFYLIWDYNNLTAGSSGTSGTNGTSGSSGTNGTSGSSGSSGSSGTNGTSGSSGTNGTSGSSGSSGTNGTSGSSGINGTNGTSGSSGTNGTSGSSGSSGSSGINGTSGSSGTDGALNALSLVAVAAAEQYSGFIDPDGITVTYNWIDRTITLSGANLNYYWHGVLHTMDAPWVSTGHTDTVGGWYLSSSDGTNFIWSQSAWLLQYIQVSYVNYTASSAYTFAIRETHGLMDVHSHETLHKAVGTIVGSGGRLTAGTFNYNSAADADTTPGFDQAILDDEDLDTIVPVWIHGTYTRMYVSGSTSIYDYAGITPFSGETNAYIRINNTITRAMSLGINNRYYNIYQILVPVTASAGSQKFRMIMLQPQVAYTTLVAAQAEDTKGLRLGTLGIDATEFVFNARITYWTQNTSNIGKVQIPTNGVTYITGSRYSQTTVAGISSSNHAGLSNLDWLNSGHIGTANKIAGFDASGLAVEYDQIAGSSGSSGTSGTNGTSGSSGSSGTNGTSGSSGTNGTSGSSGTNGTSGSSGKDGFLLTGTTQNDFLIWSGGTWVSSPGIIGLPDDTLYSDGFFDTWVTTTKISNAMDDISEIIKKLAPAKPPELSTKTVVLSSSYPSTTMYKASDGASVSYTLVSDLVTTDVQLSDMTTGSTGGGFNKNVGYNLTALIDSGSVGALTYTDGNINTGTTNNNKLTAIEYDYWGGVAGKSDFWPAIVARINDVFSGLSYGIHTSKLSWYLGLVESQTTNLLTIYYDNPVTPSGNTLNLSTAAAGNRYISGVPSLSTSDLLAVNYGFTGLVSQVYRPNPISASSAYASTVTNTLSGVQSSGTTISGTINPVVQTVYVENILVTVAATNAKGTVTTYSNLSIASSQPGKTMRVDPVSNESARKLSGGIATNFPVTYGGTFNSGTSLLTGDYLFELQMLNSAYRRISGNYTNNYPIAGPNYSSDTNSDYRWVMFSYSISTKSSINVTVAGANFSTNAGTQVTDFMKIFVKVEGSTGWLDANTAYPGVGTPINDGDYAMVTASSTSSTASLVKYVTFGAGNYTGTLYVRLGMASGSNDTLTSILIT